MHCYLSITFTDFTNDSHTDVFLFWVFFQPFDDFEACVYAAVGDLELNMTAMPTKQTRSLYLKDKFEHKSYTAFIFSVKDLYLLIYYWHVVIL